MNDVQAQHGWAAAQSDDVVAPRRRRPSASRRAECRRRAGQDDRHAVELPPPSTQRRQRRREPRVRRQGRGSLRRRVGRSRPQVGRQLRRLDHVRAQRELQEDPAMHGGCATVDRDREPVRPAPGPAVPRQDRRPLHRRRLPGAHEGRAGRRRGGGAGDRLGRRRPVQLRQRPRRRPGHGRRLLHRLERDVPEEVQHGDHDERGRDGAAAQVRRADGGCHRAQVRPAVPERRGGQPRRRAGRGRAHRSVPGVQVLPPRRSGGTVRAAGGPAGVPGQREAGR